MRLFIAVTFVFASVGCKPAELIATDAPTSVSHVTIVSLDAEGALIGATPLEPWDRRSTLSAAVPAEGAVWLLGYDEATLDAVGLLATPEAGAPDVQLSLAKGCAPRLPLPIWAGRRDGTAFESVAVALAPALTSPALVGRCPEASTDVRCAASDRAVFTGCQAEVDIGSSGEGAVVIDPDGRVCFERPDGCEERPAQGPASASLSCGSTCTVDVYVAPAPPALELTRVPIVSPRSAPYVPPTRTAVLRFFAGALQSGYAFGLSVLAEEVVVITVADGQPRRGCPSDGTIPTEFRFLDVESLEPTHTATAPTCANFLLTDPGGTTFISMYAPYETWRLGRFDARGQRLQDIDTGVRMIDGESTTRVYDFAQTDDRIAILFSTRDGVGPPSQLRLYDARTLAPRQNIDLPNTYAMAFSGPDEIALALADSSVIRVDLGSGMLSASVSIRADDVMGAPFDIVRDEDSGRLIVGSDTTLVASAIDSAGRVSGARWFEDGHALTALSPWPDAPGHFLALLLLKDGWAASLALYETDGARLLPPAVSLGHGVPNPVRLDARGRALILLPWSGEVVRVTPGGMN